MFSNCRDIVLSGLNGEVARQKTAIRRFGLPFLAQQPACSYEGLIVDDGTSNGTADFALKLALEYPKVIFA
ncbi:hypothetical protein A0H81_04735 [Grifola frondosa]|uniref:Uncharacterized protein n=1 Tax=Grifola frondosa TaxID=5627 RepID=A0A1C7MHV7_GRIFR|nr:hypothetical protein A0H81_04735 [Grifola frondosa]